MRLWSLHPKYLDPQGLVALWREGLLAKKVLEGNTKGYKNHPQLNRFKREKNSLAYINLYLHFVCDNAFRRGYNFDRTKLKRKRLLSKKLSVTRGQMEFERVHLLKKQFSRSPKDYLKNKPIKQFRTHPLFQIISGVVEDWERV